MPVPSHQANTSASSFSVRGGIAQEYLIPEFCKIVLADSREAITDFCNEHHNQPTPNRTRRQPGLRPVRKERSSDIRRCELSGNGPSSISDLVHRKRHNGSKPQFH